MSNEKTTQYGQLTETENFGVRDEGDKLKVYRKASGPRDGKVYFVKTAEVFRTVYDDE